MRLAYQRPAARQDLLELFAYFEAQAGQELADRFLTNVEETYFDLSQDPAIGSPLQLNAPQLAGLRKWRVRGFNSVLIFYLPRPDGVSVVRLLDARQDWWSRLGLDG